MGSRNPWAREIQDHLADRHVHWHEIKRRVDELSREHPDARAEVRPYIAISREAGAGGCEVARRVGSALGWRVLDREVLEFVAEQFRLEREMLTLLDEDSLSWFGESIISLIQPHLLSQDQYFARLVRVVLVALSESPGVVVGRGAHLFLPRRRGVSVRIIADLESRVARMQKERDLDERAARHTLQDTDVARRNFVKHHFHSDIADPLAYDLIVNTSRLGIDGAASVVTAACAARGLATRR
jgi:hypothetical protein